MASESLAGLDLNLLVSLNAILREQSVTRAAEKLGLSQPSLSVALRRLRAHFGDELLARSGNTYVLTPLAIGLSENAEAALDAVRRVFANDRPFDPATSDREFLIRGSDHMAVTMGVAVSEEAAKQAPGVSFRFMDFPADAMSDDVRALDECDLALLFPGFWPGLPRADVARDHWVCLVSNANTHVVDELTLDQMGTLPLIVTHQSRRSPRPAIAQLQMLGVEPNIVASVNSFLALPAFVQGTDRIALVPSRLAPLLALDDRLRVLPCPWEAVRLTVTMYWHPRHTQDPAHQWMRRLFRSAAFAASDDGGVQKQTISV